MLIQQGDVLVSVSNIPASAKVKKNHARGVVLAEGETTGHAHVITGVDDAVLFEDDGAMYLRVLKETVLTHEEHKPVTIPAGDYSVSIVKEYDHFEMESRNVQD